MRLSLDVDNVETIVVDHDKSELSRDFIRKLDASAYFHVAASLPQTKDAVDYLDHDWAKVAIMIPPDFMKSISADRETPLQIIIDGSDPDFPAISSAATLPPSPNNTIRSYCLTTLTGKGRNK